MIMRTILATLSVTVVIVVITGAVVVYSGFYDIGATAPHWGITHWVMETARVRSIKAHAAGIPVPSGLDDPARLPMGTEHFAAHCAVCHGAPGVPKGDIANGLYPQPPDLAVTAKTYSDGELFWILKHGIKMTGMPSWADHRDDELWATVAFVRKLPGMTQEEYGKLVMQSMQGSGHRMQGGESPTEDANPIKHGGKDHSGAQPPPVGPSKTEDGHGHQH
jgi:mono/diheme cytochrome c family protein